MDMNDKLIYISSDDEAVPAMEAASRKHAAARHRGTEATAREAVANRVGPNKSGSCSYDKFFVDGNHVALNSAQVSYLKEVDRKRETIPIDVCTIKEAHINDTKGKCTSQGSITLQTSGSILSYQHK